MAKTQSSLFEVPVFGPWKQYDLRERTDLPGVYLLAHMASVPVGPNPAWNLLHHRHKASDH